VAQIIPYEPVAVLEIRRASRSPRDLPVPSPVKVTDSLAILLEDRSSP
jgi:hypothetical protein